MGVLMRGEAGVAAAHDELVKATGDTSTYVRVVAAWSLAKHGGDADRRAALPLLLGLANWSQHDVFTSMSALNAIDDLGDKARPIAEQLKALPAKGEVPDGRFGGYVGRLLADLNGAKLSSEEAEPAAPKKAKGKGKGRKQP